VLVIPSQQRGIESAYGISREQLDHEAWAVDPAGRKHGGAAAINRLLAELGPPWAWAAALYAFPPVKLAETLGYRWFADHRPLFARWGVTPECDEPAADCE
jgi:predicted DCC family thiol-disulfide oxidoreductase YuxK